MQAHKANSHAGKGWESFTDAVLRHLSEQRTGLVFLLWGKHAQVFLCAGVSHASCTAAAMCLVLRAGSLAQSSMQ